MERRWVRRFLFSHHPSMNLMHLCPTPSFSSLTFYLTAAIYATTRWYRLMGSGQSFFRKIWMSLLFLYNAIQVRSFCFSFTPHRC
jgi:hypothetical protein